MPHASQLANINSMPLVPFAQITALPQKYCPRWQGFAAATLFLIRLSDSQSVQRRLSAIPTLVFCEVAVSVTSLGRG